MNQDESSSRPAGSRHGKQDTDVMDVLHRPCDEAEVSNDVVIETFSLFSLMFSGQQQGDLLFSFRTFEVLFQLMRLRPRAEKEIKAGRKAPFFSSASALITFAFWRHLILSIRVDLRLEGPSGFLLRP